MKQEKQERGKGDDQAKHGRKGYKSWQERKEQHGKRWKGE
jgi:hypothetical protein